MYKIVTFAGFGFRHLVLDVLQPGDIVLSGGRDWSSRLIQMATGSRFSHAALVVDPLLWFESLPEGQQYSAPDARLAEVDGMLRCVMKVPDGSWMRVYRPNSLKHCGSDKRFEVQDRLTKSSSKHYLLDYPGYEDFLDILRFRLGKGAFAREVAARLSKRKRPLYPGLFCSAVAIEALREAGIDVAGNKAPKEITPGGIARSGDFERVETGVVEGRAVRAQFAGLEKSLTRSQFLTRALVRQAMQVVASHKLSHMSITLNRDLTEIARLLQKESLAPDVVKEFADSLDAVDGDYQRSRLQFNPTAIHVVESARWWSKFAAAQKCSSQCLHQNGHRSCEVNGCYAGNVAYLDTHKNPPPALRSYFVAAEDAFQEIMRNPAAKFSDSTE